MGRARGAVFATDYAAFSASIVDCESDDAVQSETAARAIIGFGADSDRIDSRATHSPITAQIEHRSVNGRFTAHRAHRTHRRDDFPRNRYRHQIRKETKIKIV